MEICDSGDHAANIVYDRGGRCPLCVKVEEACELRDSLTKTELELSQSENKMVEMEADIDDAHAEILELKDKLAAMTEAQEDRRAAKGE